jgi:hypothetical protein
VRLGAEWVRTQRGERRREDRMQWLRVIEQERERERICMSHNERGEAVGKDCSL